MRARVSVDVGMYVCMGECALMYERASRDAQIHRVEIAVSARNVR